MAYVPAQPPAVLWPGAHWRARDTFYHERRESGQSRENKTGAGKLPRARFKIR
jgi:hypothetical protein